MKPTVWFTQKDLAEFLGMCVNTFKRYYRDDYPPQIIRGNKFYWSDKQAIEIQKEITSQIANPPPHQPTNS